jgi:enamine deaminase RidA (YjgF/YER057c/UK114 family)
MARCRPPSPTSAGSPGPTWRRSCGRPATLDDLVKVTTFLADRRFAAENRAVRQAVLGGRAPALTVVITGIFDETWLIEIEGVAMA